MAFPLFDIWDQAQLTDLITRPPAGRDPGAAEDGAFLLGEQIAPLKAHPSRLAKVNVSEIKPFGVGQFRAPDATPPMFKPDVTWTETVIELALLDEMERISEEDWMKLNSADDNLRRSVGVSLIDRGRILETRNRRLTEWMRWQAFSGQLEIEYPSGSKILVDYGLPAGHKPVLTSTAKWDATTTADPVADVQSWSELLADDTGFYARHLHMNSNTYDKLINNTKVAQRINFYSSRANSIQRPRRQDLEELFQSFAVGQDIVIYDNGYRDVGVTGVGRPSLTKYLPDGYVLVTTDYSIDGHNIADTLDGQVTVGTGYNSVAIRQGFQAEVMLDHLSKTHFMRAASARIPRLLYPEAFVWAKVY